MGLITAEEAKNYLRVDAADDDSLIAGMLTAAESLVFEVSRLNESEQAAVQADPVDAEALSAACGAAGITEEEAGEYRAVTRAAAFYTLGYLYEHREEADHRDLTLTLRSILFAIREGRPSA